MHRRSVVAALAVTGALIAAAVAGGAPGNRSDNALSKIGHIVVIYQENHSFDDLYGSWEGVNGLADADRAHTRQVNQAGTVFTCLLQDDVNLTSPPLMGPADRALPQGGRERGQNP